MGMKHYEELCDDLHANGQSAVEQLNILSKSHKTKVLGYQIVKAEILGAYQTCILVEVSE